MSPLAQKVVDAMYIGSGDGAISASFNEPPEIAYDTGSNRDSYIKEWGLCVGVAFALAFAENPFAGPEAAIQQAEGAAREAFYAMNKELASAERVSA
jgi:hypothetical protein